MPPSDFIPDPEWVMLGVSQPDGVLVFASRTLTMAEIKKALNHHTVGRGSIGSAQFARNEFSDAWELSVTMNEIFWATGRDYGEAIRRLFETWQPDAERLEQQDRPALDAPPRALERETGVGWAKRARTS